MYLGDLLVSIEQIDKLLSDDEVLDKLLETDGDIENLVDILFNQVDNKLTCTIMMLDNYITDMGEQISIYEAFEKKKHIDLILIAAGRLGLGDKFEQIVNYTVELNEKLSKAVYSIEVPQVDNTEEVSTD